VDETVARADPAAEPARAFERAALSADDLADAGTELSFPSFVLGVRVFLPA
jgi:hypothetical protein